MTGMLEDVFSTVRLKSAVYFKHGFCRNWGMEIPKGVYAQFHIVTGGNCKVYFNDQKLNLEKGDIIIFPHGNAHQLKDQENAVCRKGQEVVKEILSGKKAFNGDQIATQLVCGHYEMDLDINHPILNQLPDYILIKGEDYGRFDKIMGLLDLIIDELSDKKTGYDLVVLKLAEVLFIAILRHYYTKQYQGETNIFKDTQINLTVDFIHKNINGDLSIAVLSKQAGLSRTLFINRFKAALGTTPLQYIRDWKLTKAKKMLKETDLSLTEIAERIAYPSSASFSRVFSQSFKVSPGKYRSGAN